MKLLAEKLGKNDKLDRLRFIRSDGSETHCAMPRQGTLPHDLVHYVVESALPLKHGFLSLVAGGSDAGFVMQAAHDPTNLSVETEAVQVEAIVEALQTQLWGGAFDRESFLQAVLMASNSRNKPVFEFSSNAPEALYRDALLLLDQWNKVPFHQKMELALSTGRCNIIGVAADREGKCDDGSTWIVIGAEAGTVDALARRCFVQRDCP